MLTPRLGPEYTEPDWELVDHFAATYGIIKQAPKHSQEFQDAQQHLQENALAFLENCAWIMVHATHQHVLLKLNALQTILWPEFERARAEQRPLLINLMKSRREGASTLFSNWFAFRALIYPNSQTLILPKERGLGRKIVQMYETFFDFLFHGIHEDKKTRYAQYQPEQGLGGRTGERIVFGNPIDGTLGLNCEIEMMVPKEASRQGTGTIARGFGAQNVHATEVAHWPNLDAAIKSFMSVVPDNPDSAVVLETTSSGPGMPYHEFWNDCEAGDLPFTNIFVGWKDNPNNRLAFKDKDAQEAFLKELGDSEDDKWGNEEAERAEFHLDAEQLNWRRRTMSLNCKNDLNAWNKEYPISSEVAFAQGGDNFISPARMWVFMQHATPPALAGQFESAGYGRPLLNPRTSVDLVRLWEDREEWSTYFIVADFAANEEAKDHIAATVYKELEFRHVATFRGDDSYRPRLRESTEQIVAAARYYNNALIIPERNGLGQEFIQIAMNELGYSRIISDDDWQADRFPGAMVNSVRYGVPTHRGNRQAMMEDLKQLYEEEEDWEIYDALVIQECRVLRPMRTPTGLVKIQAPKKGHPRSPSSAELGYYDDLAMTNAMAAWIRHKLPKPKTREELRAIARRREAQQYQSRRDRQDQRINVI